METGYVLLQHWYLEVVAVPGFFLDLLLGDPKYWFHPVRIIGRLVRELEWRLYPKTGPPVAVLWDKLFFRLCCVGVVDTGVSLLTAGFRGVFFLFGSSLEILLSYQLLATRCLRDSVEGIARALGEGGLVTGRRVVSHIIGRDTGALDEAGIVRATVKMVTGNAPDGEMAPLFYLLLFGMIGDQVYKAVDTIGPMLGYKNICYGLFGRVAARMDDVFNWISMRAAVLLLIVAAAVMGQDVREAARIFRRGRYRYASPDSAQTGSAMAGVLGMRLAGSTSYFGERKEKPYIGDIGREIETEDIARASRMLTAAPWLSLFFLSAL